MLSRLKLRSWSHQLPSSSSSSLCLLPLRNLGNLRKETHGVEQRFPATFAFALKNVKLNPLQELQEHSKRLGAALVPVEVTVEVMEVVTVFVAVDVFVIVVIA